MTAAVVALAGGIGAVLRFLADGSIRSRTNGGFPWATLLINLTGSFVLGLMVGLSSGWWRAVLGTGLCGGYTTFSAASFESVRLLEQRRFGAAAAHAVGGLVACLAAASAGLAIAS
jgi:CrcB protein